MTNASRLLLLPLCVLALAGCTPQQISVGPDFWAKGGQRVGVAIVEPPRAAAHKAGAQGVLDMVINNSMASDLSRHLATVDVSALNGIADKVEAALRTRGHTPVRLGPVKADQLQDASPKGRKDAADKDLARLAPDGSVDAVVLIRPVSVGTERPYYGFVPLGPPVGYVRVDSQMAAAADNKLMWRSSILTRSPVTGNWDEPPAFPSVDAAIARAIAQSADDVVEDLVQAAAVTK